MVSSSLPVRRACELVRKLVEAGDVCAAQQAVPQQCQEAFKVSVMQRSYNAYC